MSKFLQHIALRIVYYVQHLVDTPVVRQVEAVLRCGESLHLQDAGGDRHSGEVDLSAGLLEAHCGIHC